MNYREELLDIIKHYKPHLLDIDILVKKEQAENNVTPENKIEKREETIVVKDQSNDNEDSFNANLDPRYTFDNFILGDENRLSYTSVRSFLSNSDMMNHLNIGYIYSNVGLGKSHLLSSLAHELKKSQYQFLFLTSERFTYNYSRFIRNANLLEFKEKFQELDFFLLDDLHFLQGKKATQQEVLNIVEHLISNNKKVLMVGDRKLGSLDNFNQKFISLMSSGIMTTIVNPGTLLKIGRAHV